MEGEAARLEEYKSLRDETLRRIDARNQTLSYTLAFAAAMFTLGLGKDGYAAALLIYPIIAFFFATAFSHSSLMLIQIGRYLRALETEVPGLNWATTLRPRYRMIELFELVSTSGLFLGTELIGILLYRGLPAARQDTSEILYDVSIVALALTIGSCFYPWFHHRLVLQGD